MTGTDTGTEADLSRVLMTQLPYYTDPSHGWVRITDEQLMLLNLTRDVFSHYSYQDASGVFAEEDVDAGHIVNAAMDLDIEIGFVRQHLDAPHWVRNLARIAP